MFLLNKTVLRLNDLTLTWNNLICQWIVLNLSQKWRFVDPRKVFDWFFVSTFSFIVYFFTWVLLNNIFWRRVNNRLLSDKDVRVIFFVSLFFLRHDFVGSINANIFRDLVLFVELSVIPSFIFLKIVKHCMVFLETFCL